ncbi:invasion protein [Rhizobium dioscoreae]|nr:invasion protein [Rhizobium dioscoreae]
MFHAERFYPLSNSAIISSRTISRISHAVLAFISAGFALTPAPLAFAQSALPNGASSLQETYQDWHVACNQRDKAASCALSQDQTQQNGQRLLAVEMQMRPDGSALATLLLPFGIVLDSGVTPNIDDQPPLKPVRFRTCLPNGCIALLPIDAPTLAKLRTGSRLNLKVVADGGNALGFQVSLQGFSAAADRVVALASR